MSQSILYGREELLLRAIRGTDVSVFYQDLDLRYTWIENPPEGWIADEIIGRCDEDILPSDTAQEIIDVKQHVITHRRNRRYTYDTHLNNTVRSFDMWIDPDLDDKGEVRGLLCSAVEVTERRRREVNLRQLLLEVSHRSRNLLAIVQSIAVQTVRNANTTEGFLKRFTERLQSIAHSLDVITHREWDGATLHELAHRQISPFLDAAGRFEILGKDPVLNANASLHIGLAIQELASNASTYGAWHHGDGRVVVTVEPDDKAENDNGDDVADPNDRGVIFTWTEERPVPINGPSTVRFGSKTLSNLVPNAVDGSAKLTMEDKRIVYSLNVPPENFRL